MSLQPFAMLRVSPAQPSAKVLLLARRDVHLLKAFQPDRWQGASIGETFKEASRRKPWRQRTRRPRQLPAPEPRPLHQGATPSPATSGDGESKLKITKARQTYPNKPSRPKGVLERLNNMALPKRRPGAVSDGARCIDPHSLLH